MGLELITIENGRIMAGRDHDAAYRLPLFDGIRNGRSWNGTGRKHDLKSIGGEDLGCALPELIGKKSPIITDNDRIVRVRRLERGPCSGGGLDSSLQVVESEILGDHSPPAICAEFDIHAYQIP
jgi:hypothetical protein